MLIFDDGLVAGMLETTRIRREGYAFRPRFEEFVERYKIFAFNPTSKVEAGSLSVQKLVNMLY